jgi:hypothetical protein
MLNADEARRRLETYETVQQHGEKNKLDPSFAKSGHFANAWDAWHRQWQAEKRPLTEGEVVQAKWLKIGRHGRTLSVRPLPDGTLEECELFFPKEQWQGSWRIEDGVLVVQVGWYVLYVVGSRSGLHSGLEFDEQTGDEYAYYQVVAVPSA